jgi:hypothetical protein
MHPVTFARLLPQQQQQQQQQRRRRRQELKVLGIQAAILKIPASRVLLLLLLLLLPQMRNLWPHRVVLFCAKIELAQEAGLRPSPPSPPSTIAITITITTTAIISIFIIIIVTQQSPLAST